MVNDAPNARTHPVSVIALDKVAELEFLDGTEAAKHEYTPPKEQTWSVKGSGKNWYTVSVKDERWSCSCPGFGFRQKCKHVDAKKVETANVGKA
jgi:hypothetical protein